MKTSNFKIEKLTAWRACALIMLISCLAVYAPLTAQTKMAKAGSESSENGGNSDKKSYPPGSAWTLSWPLGTHIESTLDTLLYNYQRRFVESMRSDAWATTGAYTAPALNMMYFERREQPSFLFESALDYWIPSFSKQKFYNVYTPMTQLEYGWGIGTENRTDHLGAIFAGNVNRKVGIGAWVDYPYTKGSYAYQAAKGLGWGFSGYYAGDRYEMQAFYNHYNHLNKENGGITDDLYITNPAELQGGVSKIEPQSIPVNLTAAHSRVRGGELYMSHAYKLGFWRDITQPEDTVPRQEFVPHTKFVYTFDWKKDTHVFRNDNATEAEKFWQNIYFNNQRTHDKAEYWSVSNTLGIEMMEGFQKWAKFGLAAYATYEVDRNGYEVSGMDDPEVTGNTTLPEGWAKGLKRTRNRLWVGGRLEKTKGSIIRYAADARFGLIGDAIGDVDASGRIDTRFRLGKDTVRISAHGFFRNLEPNYMLNHYVSNHFIWNNDFGKIRSFRVGGQLHIPWTWTTLKVGFENVQNQIYFNSSSIPKQHGGSVQVFSAAIQQNLKLGIFNWDNTFTYQKSSNTTVIPLPEFVIYSNMYLYFHAFRALTVQFGVDVDWYSAYKGPNYQPATMQFTAQGDNAVNVGNFINSNVYLTCKLYKVRFFAVVSNLSQGWFSKGYFSLPHYPIDPRQFRIGLMIDFAN
jgi:hypothetical protein